MAEPRRYLAADIGASSGRVMLGEWNGEKMTLSEVHRFPNGPVERDGHYYTDAEALFTGIRQGLKAFGEKYGAAPAGIGVDTWGVDYGLLGPSGELLAPPYHYRDGRTNGIMERAFERFSRQDMFNETDIQFMQINTVFQLYSMVCGGDRQLDEADTLLMMPDLFHYWLTGKKVAEYTIATTSQMVDARRRQWATGMLAKLGIPTGILPPIVMPGMSLGDVKPELLREMGWKAPAPVIASGSHDTASAVAAVPELDSRSVYLSSGTWSLIGVETAEPVINEKSAGLNLTNEGGVAGTIRLLKNIMGLWLVQESQRQWEREGKKYGWPELIAEAEKAKPFQSLLNPDAQEFLSPGDMPAAIRGYCRKTGQPEPATVGEIVRAALESLALKYRQVLGSLESLTGAKMDAVRIVGGGSLNGMLNRFTAKACGVPVKAGPVEATAIGNVMMQMVATGALPDVATGRKAFAKAVDVATYDPEKDQAWEDAYGRFEKLPE